VLLEGIRALSEVLMETEVAGLIDAARHERSSVPLRDAHTDVGHTRMGTIKLPIPRSRGAPTWRPPSSSAARAPTDAKVSTDTIVQ
jgi:hypothetical protein